MPANVTWQFPRRGTIARQLAWLRSFWSLMRPYASGQAYQNYADPDLKNWRQAC